MSQVLYRKYRPESFAYVVGQSHVVSVLQAAVDKKKPAHAYLFFGGRGTGKTSIARIFAKGLGIDPQDIYEIDAASNRKIDDIRELRQGVKTLPFASQYKMYIIDEVHMLTNEAFNALLKTLEEPPAHVLFVLATTELHKIPDTIVSRCQLFTFKKPNESHIAELLERVCKEEKRPIEPAAALQVAFTADRSFRDALGALDKLLGATDDKKITLDHVEQILGVPSRESMYEYIAGLVDGDADQSLGVVAKLRESGARIDFFVEGVLHIFRNLLFIRFAPKQSKEIMEQVGEKEQEFYKDILTRDKKIVTSKTLQVLLELHQELPFSKYPEMLLELAVVDIVGERE
jgi:DNA polymerase-3 subunit gamma/tau